MDDCGDRVRVFNTLFKGENLAIAFLFVNLFHLYDDFLKKSQWFHGVVVITFVLHTKCHEFDPHWGQFEIVNLSQE